MYSEENRLFVSKLLVEPEIEPSYAVEINGDALHGRPLRVRLIAVSEALPRIQMVSDD